MRNANKKTAMTAISFVGQREKGNKGGKEMGKNKKKNTNKLVT